MLREVEWGKLDIMVVDMPPGTGDAQLTMAQQVPLKGAVNCLDASGSGFNRLHGAEVSMFKRVNVPGARCCREHELFPLPDVAERGPIFLRMAGARHEAERLGVPFLGEVPLHMTIREKSDAGLPVVATVPDSEHARIYRDIASKVLAQLKGGAGGKTAPKIVIEA
jgi:ATP-binding protein involved in chromosome partitioning